MKEIPDPKNRDKSYIGFEAWTNTDGDYGHVGVVVRKIRVADAGKALANRLQYGHDNENYYRDRLSAVLKATGVPRHFDSSYSETINFTCQCNGDADKNNGANYYGLRCTAIDVCDEWQARLFLKLNKLLGSQDHIGQNHLGLIWSLKKFGAVQVRSIDKVMYGYALVPAEELTYPVETPKKEEAA